ncbi:hypothetical protein [Luteimonas aquatica]|uniref:hypothetical protein n=1 Tax=Luteimonas aquatica TaxID=450364 RepID=UPI001F575C29|nr:hypothetical protein [Luteimonas aquatica]
MQFRYILIALLGLGALIGAYFLGRAQNLKEAVEAGPDMAVHEPQGKLDVVSAGSTPITATLPARDLPLKRIFNDLRARADAGDVAAATRLYRDLRTCAGLDSLDWFLARAADETLDDKVDGTNAQALENYRVQLEAVESRKQVIQKTRQLCDGIDRSMLESQLTSLQKAAQLGEEHARACYLSNGPAYDSRGLMRHPEWLQDYRTNVKSMIDAGLEAGDWKIVDIVRRAYEPGSDGMLAGVLGQNPVEYYRYLKLYRLGAEEGRTSALDRQLAAAAARIKPEQRADADLWAQAKFRQTFDNDQVSTSVTPKGWDPCSFPYDPL